MNIIIINIYIRLFSDIFFENNQNKNLIYYRKSFFLCINQAFKGDWRMPWHCKTMKDVVYCDKFRGVVCKL